MAFEQGKWLTNLRTEFDWVRDLPAQCGQQELRHLDQAYKNWWNKDLPAGAPIFHKRGTRLSVSFPGQACELRKLSKRWSEVKLPKLGWVKIRTSRPIRGTLRNVTMIKDALGWQCSLGLFQDVKPAEKNNKPGCGVDFGIACSAFVSDEVNPRLKPASLTPGEQRRLLGLERRFSRQKTFAKRHNSGKYSNRARRTKQEIAKLQARAARRRLDFTHKLTTDLAKNHGYVGIEDLRMKNMTKSAKGTTEQPGTNVAQKSGLNKALLDNAAGQRRRQLDYKCPRFGSELRVVPAPFTSQQCSECGVIDPENRNGCGREFSCTNCGHEEHADLNAAKNIDVKAHAAGPAVNSTGRHKPSHSKTRVGGSVNSTSSPCLEVADVA